MGIILKTILFLVPIAILSNLKAIIRIMNNRPGVEGCEGGKRVGFEMRER